MTVPGEWGEHPHVTVSTAIDGVAAQGDVNEVTVFADQLGI